MESTMSLKRSGLIPLQEHLLQGSILEMHRDLLLHRLNGLCDMVDKGPVKFKDHEMIFQIAPTNANMQPVIFRVRHSIEHPEAPWHLRYVNNAEMGDKTQHTLSRICIEAGTSSNVALFLQEMGFRLDHEFVVTGHMFRKGRMKITVAKLFRVVEQGNLDNIEAMTSSCVVELSVVALPGHEQIQEDIKNFAEQLKPLVHLEKIDHRKLQQQMTKPS